MSSRFHAVFIALLLLGLPALAHADYQTDKDNGNLDTIDRALKKFQADPAIFDGKKITANATPSAITAHFQTCNNGVTSYTRYFKQVSAKGKATPRAQALTKQAAERQKWCKALAAAGDAYIKKVNDAANAQAAAKKANKDMCFKLYREVSKALPNSGMHRMLDTNRGARTMVGGEGMGEFKGWIDSLAGVCKKAEYKDAVNSCKGLGIMLSSETNARYNYGDLCAPAQNVQKTLTDAAMRSLEHMSRDHQKAPTLQNFRLRKGWLRDTEHAISYKTYFTVTDKVKERLLGQAKEVFGAAGVPVPKDLSRLWKQKQAYLDTLKTLVDTTANEWKIDNYKKCKGYPCGLAKKSISKGYKGAKIKTVFGSNDWKIHKNGLGIPLNRTVSVTVVMQAKGEPYCQARAFTVSEEYKGGGKYKKAKGTNWGYARFQKCQ